MENEDIKIKNKKKKIILIVGICLIPVLAILILFMYDRVINKTSGDPINEKTSEDKKIEEITAILNSHTEDIGNVENLIYDVNNNDNYRFTQTYKGLEVYGGGIVATLKGNELSSIINYNYEIPEDFNTEPINTESDLLEIAKEYLGYNSLTLNDSDLIIYPIDINKFTLAYMYEFDIGTVIVSDSDKTVLGTTTIYNDTSIDKSVTDAMDDRFDDIIQENYNNLVDENKNITKDETREFLQTDGTYLLYDKNRNIEVYRIKDTYSRMESFEFMQNSDEYYTSITWNNIQEANWADNYHAIKAMKNLQKVYDYYNEEFNFISMKGNEEYKLKVYINFSKVDSEIADEDNKYYTMIFSDNAVLFFFNSDDMRIYFGSLNLYNDDLEVVAHEYTHGYFRRAVDGVDSNKANSINEAYSDIMGMIIEAYYNSEDSKLDGIYNDRNIKDSELKYTDYNDNIENHEASMIVSKVAYLMSINEELDLDIDELSRIWFNSMYKFPKHTVNYSDVETAVLLQAKELGYSKEKIRIMADIFVSMGYPDCYEKCVGDWIFNIREVQHIDKNKAVDIVQNNFSDDWKGIEVEYECVATVMDEDKNTYYAINRYAKENYMHLGGEWLKEITNGRYYAGTYYVRDSCILSTVYIGYNPRDYEKYSDGDIVDYFLEHYYVEINTTSNSKNTLVQNATNLSDNNTEKLKIGSKTIKYGTYEGIDAAIGDILVIKSDKTATLNGNNYTYTVGKHNFSQDSSSDSYEDAIIFKTDKGETAFALYVRK